MPAPRDGSVLSWEQANAYATEAGKRLPVTAELQAAGISVSDDLWTPIHTMTCDDQHTGRRDGSLGNGQNAWANIGPRRYQVEHPSWGLDSSMTGGRSTHFWVSDGGEDAPGEGYVAAGGPPYHGSRDL